MKGEEFNKDDSASWYDHAWTRRIPITVHHKMVSGTKDLIDFPMFFDWQHANFCHAQASGADFLFTARDGITKLSHEIRSWDIATCRLRGYVKIPCLSPHRDTLLFLYYGNPDATNQEDGCGVWQNYSYVGKPATLADHTLRVLEELFGDPGLEELRARRPAHPAVLRYDAISAVKQGAVRWPNDCERIIMAGVAALDSLDVQESGAKAAWELVAEPETLRLIKTRLEPPENFFDQLAVIRCWALLSAQGVNARLIERDGLPDIRAELSSNDTWVEVKRIRVGTPATRVRRVLSKANRQIMNTLSEGSGVADLELSRPIEVAALTDELPGEIIACVAEVKRELGSGSSRSIGRVIVAWDSFAILGQPPEKTMFVFRRQTVVLDHPSARSIPPIQLGAEAGKTVEFFLRWDNRENETQSRSYLTKVK
jgi:hypothetical protein